MLSPVPNSRRALAAQAPKLSRAGASDDDIGLLRRAVLEYSSTLEHEAARFPCNVPDDPLEADERGRAVAELPHECLWVGTAPPNGSRLSCGRLALRRNGDGRGPCPRGARLRVL